MAAIMTEREKRVERLRPLFAYLARYKTPLRALAREIGLEKPRNIYHIRDGLCVTPERFVERVCAALGVRPEEVGYYPLRPVRGGGLKASGGGKRQKTTRKADTAA